VIRVNLYSSESIIKSIFQHAQKVRLTEEQKKCGLSSDHLRVGDNLRKQFVWEEWLAELQTRLNESKESVRSLQQEVQDAQARLDAFCAVESASNNKTRATHSTIGTNAETAASLRLGRDVLLQSFDATKQALAAAVEYHEQTTPACAGSPVCPQ
jgi:uncharacterized protein YhaN